LTTITEERVYFKCSQIVHAMLMRIVQINDVSRAIRHCSRWGPSARATVQCAMAPGARVGAVRRGYPMAGMRNVSANEYGRSVVRRRAFSDERQGFPPRTPWEEQEGGLLREEPVFLAPSSVAEGIE
jgi:hypothetical protein